jgi:hypothetical protein
VKRGNPHLLQPQAWPPTLLAEARVEGTPHLRGAGLATRPEIDGRRKQNLAYIPPGTSGRAILSSESAVPELAAQMRVAANGRSRVQGVCPSAAWTTAPAAAMMLRAAMADASGELPDGQQELAALRASIGRATWPSGADDVRLRARPQTSLRLSLIGQTDQWASAVGAPRRVAASSRQVRGPTRGGCRAHTAPPRLAPRPARSPAGWPRPGPGASCERDPPLLAARVTPLAKDGHDHFGARCHWHGITSNRSGGSGMHTYIDQYSRERAGPAGLRRGAGGALAIRLRARLRTSQSVPGRTAWTDAGRCGACPAGGGR